MLPDALRRALQLGITLFDALYIVLADDLGVQFVTGDERLLRSPAGALPLMRDLRTFRNRERPQS